MDDAGLPCPSLLFGAALVAAVAIGVGNAGNDLCNSVGVVVGSGTLSLRQAVCVGALFDCFGGLAMGARVTNTIAAGIVNGELFEGPGGPDLLAKSMLICMLSGGVTMLTGTLCRVPISAHHSVVGSLVAMAVLTRGPSAVHWELVKDIVFSWVGNPLLGMLTSFVTFSAIHGAILRTPSPRASFVRWQPVLYVFTACTCLPFVLTKSPWLKASVWLAFAVSIAVGLVASRFADALVDGLEAAKTYAHRPVDQSSDLDEPWPPPRLTSGEAVDGAARPRGRGFRVSSHTDAAGDDDDDDLRERAPIISTSELRGVERSFTVLLVISALSVATVHGAQDVSNVAGPLTTITRVLHGAGDEAAVGGLTWPLLLGVAAFGLGDLVLGGMVITTVGSKITDFSPSRAYAAQVGTVFALFSATAASLPVSSSECIVGSVIGVGIGKKLLGYADDLDFKVLRKIWLAWALTIPYAGTIASVLFFLVELACPSPGGVANMSGWAGRGAPVASAAASPA